MVRDTGGASRLYLKTLFENGAVVSPTDGQLLERFATGTGDIAELAFGVIVERHGTMVFRACQGILHNDHDAMDAFQATFLVLVRKGRSLWVRDSLGPWLHRVACRVARRARVIMGRRRTLQQQLTDIAIRAPHEHQSSDVVAAVHEELNHLAERYRAPIVLCDLEGRSCEEAARYLGCPVGTIGSRLARGRGQLRARLARRGLAPTAGLITTAATADAHGTTLPTSLMESTARLGHSLVARKGEAGTSSTASMKLAEDILRSMFMTRLVSAAAIAVTTLGLGLAVTRSIHAGAEVLVTVPKAPEKVQADIRPAADDISFFNDKESLKDFVYAEIGNMRPLIVDEKGVRFQSRQAVVYKDGSAKLWGPQQKAPLVGPLRHKGSIKELTFFDEATLLITTSDESVKIWNGLTGEFRKELPGQAIRPMWLSFAPGAKRFVTTDADGKSITVWDAHNLASMATLRPPIDQPIEAAGLSGDGRTIAIFRFGARASVELHDVESGQGFATFRLPSRSAVEVFGKDGVLLIKENVQLEGHFWEVVRSLSPADKQKK